MSFIILLFLSELFGHQGQHWCQQRMDRSHWLVCCRSGEQVQCCCDRCFDENWRLCAANFKGKKMNLKIEIKEDKNIKIICSTDQHAQFSPFLALSRLLVSATFTAASTLFCTLSPFRANGKTISKRAFNLLSNLPSTEVL